MGTKTDDLWVTDVLIPVLDQMCMEHGYCTDSFTNADWLEVMVKTGSQAKGFTMGDVQRLSTNLRKAGKLRRNDPTRRHGPTKLGPKSPQYMLALSDPKFVAFFDALCKSQSWHCCVCNAEGVLKPHHRVWDPVDRRTLYDCIAVCPKCEKVCRVRLQREKQ